MARWDGHSKTDPAKLWPRIDASGLCWIWTGPQSSNGYGFVKWGGQTRRVHRVVWEVLVGPIPEGLTMDHLCRVTLCCNPDHLEPVTHRENVLRGYSPHARSARVTHCPKGHPYTDENTYLDQGRRRCRICLAAKWERAKEKKRNVA